MREKYDSTDFWYTFLNSLYNFGLSAGTGELEMDAEMQDKLIAYFKTKIEEGVTDGESALPPTLSDYFWRFPKEMLPKLRSLAESFLDTDPDNGPASVLLATVAYTKMGFNEVLPFMEKALTLLPKDLCLNLLLIKEYRRRHGSYGHITGKFEIFTALENIFEWAKQQDNSARYHEVRFFYRRQRVTPYSVYTSLKTFDKRYWEKREGDRIMGIGEGKGTIGKCRDLISEEQAVFNKVMVAESTDSNIFENETSENTDFWDAYLDTLDNRGLSVPKWKLTPKVQEKLLDYFKTKIEAGVIDGLTTLPSQLPEYVPLFPDAMLLELREFAEDVYEKQPENGAAAKILAVIEQKGYSTFNEQAITLVPNDAEICFYAINYNTSLTLLEELFERAQRQGKSELYHWLVRLYKEVGTTPCVIYRKLMKSPEENAELITRYKVLIVQAQQAFEHHLEHEPNDWYALRGLGDIYETLGETELAQEYPWEPHPEFRWNQEAWVGLQLPHFSATAVDGTPISVSDYHGKMLVLNFCAKWCGFCAPEIPYLKKVYEEYHNKGLEVIGVSLDENETELRKFIEEHEIPWQQLFDEEGGKGDLAHYFGVTKVPSQWFIDRNRKISSVDTRKEQLSQLVKWTEMTRIGNIVPDFSAVDVNGKPVSPKAYRGKVVLLYFWTSQDYCEEELTYIDTVYQKYHTKGFDIISVNIAGWKNEEDFHRLLSERNYQGHHIYDGGKLIQGPLAQQFAIQEIPTLLLIDTNGKVIEARSGKVHSPEAWAVRLEELVATHLGLC
ncbi:MAG: TlpA disulfide reductase family protein [Candidatus Poribacteria bacterium]|nr:TlpA disulfide reductase family protein [Candidatus Poribacteria bacterium]